MTAAPSTPPAAPVVHTSARDRARLKVLALAQAELTGGATPSMRAAAASALEAAGVGNGFTVKYVREGWISVRELLAIALRCTVVSRCGCGAEISGAEWPHLHLVGVQRFDDEAYELRNCGVCGSTRAARIP